MHHLTKKSAVEKYSALTGSPEEVKAAIAEDPKGFTADEIDEIFEALPKTGTSYKPEIYQPPVEPKAPEKPKTQGEALGLGKFNYHGVEGRFTGDQFKEYEALVLKLPLTKQFDFEVYKASPVKVERYPGLPQSPVDIVGVKIELQMPLFTTRVEARHALEMNKQLQNSGRYYLLKK